MTLKPEDVRIDSYQAAIPGAPYSVRMTHTPTGKYTEYHSDQSYFRAKKAAEQELINLVTNDG